MPQIRRQTGVKKSIFRTQLNAKMQNTFLGQRGPSLAIKDAQNEVF